MSADLIARALANKAQSAIANGNLPYAQGSTFNAGTIGRKLQETVSIKDFGAKGDGTYAYNCAMAAGSATLTVSLSGFTGFTAADVGKIITVPGAGVSGAALVTTISAFVSSTSVMLAAAASTTVSGQQITFGTNDTAAVQAFSTYLTTNHRHGTAPAGMYCVNATVGFAHQWGWGVRGDGPESAIFVQMADNIPVFDIGYGDNTTTGNNGGLHTVLLENLRLSYAALQPSTNTNAFCLVFSGMCYWSTMRRITFERGYDGIKVRTGIGGPWGSNWDDLRFVSNLSGSAMDWTGAINGVPNNRWGRFVVEMNSMSKYAFNQVKGYNWTIETIEVLGNVGTNANGGTGNGLMNFQSGSRFTIHAIKSETFNFTGTHALSSASVIYAPACSGTIDHLFFGGTQSVFNTSAAITLIGGGTTAFHIRHLLTSLSAAPVNVYVSGASAGDNRLESHSTGSAGPIPLTNIGGSAAANFISYGTNAQGHMSDDIGDANYTLATNGGPNVIVAQTALTASRTVEIMNDTNYLFNGYKVTVISRGAVNGTNTLVIKAGGNTKATISSDNYAVELTYRRNPTAHAGWVITRQGSA